MLATEPSYDSQQSLLWQVLDEDAKLHMPPDGQLNYDEIAGTARLAPI